MIIDDKHIIQKANIDFNFKMLDSDKMNSNRFVEWSRANVLEVLDEHAEKLVDKNSVVQIQKLDINLNLEGNEDFFNQSDYLKAAISNQILEALQKALKENKRVALSFQKHHANTILLFLETGQLTQNCNEEEWQQLSEHFNQELLTNPKFQIQLLGIIVKKDQFYRFYNFIKREQLHAFLIQTTAEKDAINWIKKIKKLFAEFYEYFNPISLKEIYYLALSQLQKDKKSFKLILQTIVVENLKASVLSIKNNADTIKIQEQLSLIFKEEVLVPKFKIPIANAHKKNIEKEEVLDENIDVSGMPIYQAGLVLLAPFLPMFLKNIGFINQKGRLIKTKKLPILLHYLATGENSTPEWKLTLPKLLSGLKFGQYCNTEINVTKKLDTQINELLSSVIEHWDTLKNTSVEGFRDTFLNREGVLKLKNGFYYLHVKEETFDILMAYISWNYSTIKFDWMKEILFVEWHKT